MLQKSDFIERLAKKGYTKHAAGIIIDDFVLTLTEILAEGEAMMFRGFGTFEVREYAEKEGTDPQTGERIKLPAHRAPKFTSGKLLRRAVKEGLIRE